MQETLENTLRQAAPACDHWSARWVDESSEQLSVRHNRAQAPVRRREAGVMLGVVAGRGLGYAATSDLTVGGLRQAFSRARALAQASAAHSVVDYGSLVPSTEQGDYRSPVQRPIGTLSLSERYAVLDQACRDLRVSDLIVDSQATLWTTHTEQLFLSSAGARQSQQWDFVVPNLKAVAHNGQRSQTRSLAGQYNGHCQQGGLEVLARSGLREDAQRVGREAVELLDLPGCPSGTMDLILMPDQMMLQIHESIGHPLELDRILGDERNFAGTSFVTLDMFGHFQYGSELLNVSYDPERPEQFASFAFDDEGAPAQRRLLIERGRLMHPLGGRTSQARAALRGHDIGGVSTTRACAWNRPPMDRMSNLNVEPGDASFDDIIASTELGVVMDTNCSWSIDDSRNKFQFGCEQGQMVRDGRLAERVRNPNYRGVSREFWRSLAMVGNADTFRVMGTPFCGKGEPNQVVRVGHAAPVCKFTGVSVFGGAA